MADDEPKSIGPVQPPVVDPLARIAARIFRRGADAVDSPELREAVISRVRQMRERGESVVEAVRAIRAIVRDALAQEGTTWANERVVDNIVAHATRWTLEQYPRGR